MKRLAFSASLAALMLAACAPEQDTPAGQTSSGDATAADLQENDTAETATVTPESVPAVDADKLVFEETTEDYSVRVSIDPKIAEFQPVLAEDLMTSTKDKLESFKSDAVRDGTAAREMAAEGEESWFRRYSLEYKFTQTAHAGDVISIHQFMAVDTGGAHPNYTITGLVHERQDEYPLPIDAVIADPAIYGAKLKAALIAEKERRAYDDAARAGAKGEIEGLFGEDDRQAGLSHGSNFVLEPSTEAGKFGGITVLFSPYEVGPYAEGSYEVTIPAADLAGALRPDWVERFGGEPLPSEEPEDQQ